MSGPREHHRTIQRTRLATTDVSILLDRVVHKLKSRVTSELDTLRTETQTAQNDSATAASQTAAMISLNLKLQSSASKNQARNIDLELKKIEAREAREFLLIIQVQQ